MGLGGRIETDQEADRKEVKLERHRPLSLMMGWRRSSERRETLLRPFYSRLRPLSRTAKEVCEFPISVCGRRLRGKGILVF